MWRADLLERRARAISRELEWKFVEVEDESGWIESSEFTDCARESGQWGRVDSRTRLSQGSGLCLDVFAPGDELDRLHGQSWRRSNDSTRFRTACSI